MQDWAQIARERKYRDLTTDRAVSDTRIRRATRDCNNSDTGYSRQNHTAFQTKEMSV